jgi:two-component system NarL family sensor kinase
MQKITDNIFFLVLLATVGSALLVTSFIFLSIYNNNKLLRQKRKLQEAELMHQKELLYAVIDSQEKERQRIGSDLHDEVGASLSALRMMIENVIDKTNLLPHLLQFSNQSKSIIDAVITSTRNISHDLSPFGNKNYGFMDALEDLMDHVNHAGMISIELQSDSDLAGLPKQTSLALYRIFSELINNTIKHAQANRILLSITEQDNKLSFQYQDDGIGLKRTDEKVSHGIGMRNIESRLHMIHADYFIKEDGSNGFEIKIELSK